MISNDTRTETTTVTTIDDDCRTAMNVDDARASARLPIGGGWGVQTLVSDFPCFDPLLTRADRRR